MPFDLSPSPPATPHATAAAPAALCQAHKFGGSSLANAERFRGVATLLGDEAAPRIAVVSAMQGVTDALTALARSALANQPWQDDFTQLHERHLGLHDVDLERHFVAKRNRHPVRVVPPDVDVILPANQHASLAKVPFQRRLFWIGQLAGHIREHPSGGRVSCGSEQDGDIGLVGTNLDSFRGHSGRQTRDGDINRAAEVRPL